MKLMQDAFRGILNGDLERVESAVRGALKAGTPAQQLLNETLIPAMAEVGRLFEEQEYFLPELIVAGKAMQAGVAILRPELISSGAVATIGKVILGTVEGDLHDIGKNLVGMMLEGAGFEVVDVGIDARASTFVAAARQGGDLIGISALLTSTMSKMADVIDAVTEAGLRAQLKIMVGGAPVTQGYADRIGADGYAPDASSAARLAKELLNL